MVVHQICIGCIWNNYPLCKGTVIDGIDFMKINNLNLEFQCGQKDNLEVNILSFKMKSDLELKFEELEKKVIELEKEVKK